jgi:hypothetical protein
VPRIEIAAPRAGSRERTEEDRLSEPSVNSKVRLHGGIGASDKPSLPLAARAPAQAAAAPVSITPAPAPPVQTDPIFLGDSADGADVLDAAELVQPLAQLCVIPQVQTPFLAAVAGASGAGKTFALRRLGRAIIELGASSAASGGGALARVVLAHVDAGSGVEAPVAMASAAYAALDREPGGVDYSALLDETGHAGGDPQRAARAASDRHDDLVRKVEAGRSHRGDVEGKRARLADTLLFETPGSRIGVFARARRGMIEERLRRFGLAGSDADASYRHLVRDMSTLGAGARIGIVIRAIWAYGSQARLLMWAILAFALAFGVGLLHGEAAVAAIGRLNGALEPVAAWIAAHGEWFGRASQVLYVLGALAIALNLWRALGFSNLLLRGARLLNLESRERRRDFDQRATRLNQRVAALTAEAEAAAKRAEAASHRAGGGKTSGRAPRPEFLESGHAPAAARAFLAALGARIGHPNPAAPAPDRLILAIDNLDALSPDAAIAWIEAAQNAIGPGCVGLLAFDPARLAATLGGPRKRAGGWESGCRSRSTCRRGTGPTGSGSSRGCCRTTGQPSAAPDAKLFGGARRAAVERGNVAAGGARPARRRFAARRQAVRQRLSAGALLRLVAAGDGAHAGCRLRRRRRAGGDARPPRQGIGRARRRRRPKNAVTGASLGRTEVSIWRISVTSAHRL